MSEIRTWYGSLGRRSKTAFLLLPAVVVIFAFAMIVAASSGAFSSHKPGKGTTVSTANPKVSVYVTHDAKLDAGSVWAELNGAAVEATFLHKGYWTEDYDTGEMTYTVTDEKEGTLTVSPGKLDDGLQTVTAGIRDMTGNELQDTWSFTVAEKPKFSSYYPANNRKQKTLDRVSVVITDNTAVDWGSVIFKINGTEVPFDADTATGKVTHTRTFANGTYQANVEASDTAGNKQAVSWSFTVDNEAPVITRLRYFTDGMTITDGKFRFEARINDLIDIKDNAKLKLNGEVLAASFFYKGEWNYDGDEYHIHSKKEADIDYQGTLPSGEYALSLYVEDELGNAREYNWTFTVAIPPLISDIKPAHNSEHTAVSQVSAKVSGNGDVDWDSVLLKVNGTAVITLIDESTGNVSYDFNFPNGIHEMKLDVSNLAGITATQTWNFTVDNKPPVITQLRYFTDGMTISDGRLRFEATINDAMDIKENAALKLNGDVLPATFLYEGEWSYDGDEYFIHSKKEADIYYDGTVPSGNHTLTLYVEDKLGNAQEYSWTFSVAIEPLIKNVHPVTYGLNTLTPQITADVSVESPESVVMIVNGEIVQHSFSAGKVTYMPEVPLADESYHVVSLTVTDINGLSVSRTWFFYIKTNDFPEMADSSIDNCLPCHDLYPFTGSAGPYEDVHGRRLSFSGTHDPGDVWDCYKCHDYITEPAGCQQCHMDYDNSPPLYDYAPHGSTPDIQYYLQNYNQDFPVRIRENREMFDCVICHQPGTNVKYAHDIPQLHITNDEGCAPCHALSLTREHARPGRTDHDGNPVNCLTCHGSSDDTITTAIKNGDTSCTVCHALDTTGAAHAEYHFVSYGQKCVECHSDNMMTETQYHGEAGCGVCHESADTGIRAAIQWQKDSCFDCHEKPHDVYMASVRNDIPLYGDVLWGTPQNALLWSGEPWLPEVFENELARVVFSSRGTGTATSAAVYQSYSGEMDTAGWTLLDGSYSEGAEAFFLSYKKGRRFCTIWFYTGEMPGSTGEMGGRIKIAYF
jgi:hypothetical protein